MPPKNGPKVDTALVQQRAAEIQPVGAKRSAAMRTLRQLHAQDPGTEVSEANLKLVAALRDLGVGNLNLAVFKKFQTGVVLTESVKQPVYIIKKQDKPGLGRAPGFVGFGEDSWLLDPDSLKGNIDKDAWWFIDVNCPCVPKGAKIWEAAVSLVQKGALSEGSVSLEQEGPPPVPSSPAPQNMPAHLTEVVNESPAKPPEVMNVSPEKSPEKPRELRERGSDSDMNDEDFKLELIRKADACFQNNLVYDPDPNKVTAHSVFQRYVLYLKSCSDQTANGAECVVPEVMRDFFKFIVKSLLQRRSFPWIGHFVTEMVKVQQFAEALVPATGKAIIAVSKSDLSSLDQVNLSCLDHKQDLFFKHTEFYKSYLAERPHAIFKKVQGGHDMDVAQRKRHVDYLLEGSSRV